MGHQRDVRKTALAEARLSGEEEALAGSRSGRGCSLGNELRSLLSTPRAKLTGEFLRAFTDDPRLDLEPELCVMRSLQRPVAASALLVEPGDGRGAADVNV